MATFRKRHSRKYRNKNTRRTKNRRNARKSHIKRRSKKSLRGGLFWSDRKKVANEDHLKTAIEIRDQGYIKGDKARAEILEKRMERAAELSAMRERNRAADEKLFVEEVTRKINLEYELAGKVPTTQEIDAEIVKAKLEREDRKSKVADMTDKEKQALYKLELEAAYANR